MKILCVDGDTQTVDLLAQQLAIYGYSLHGVFDTLSAIEVLEKHLDFNLMICEYKLEPGTAEPIFWYLSVNNYSLSSIIYCSDDCNKVKLNVSYPDLITIVQKPNLLQLSECVRNFAALIAQATRTST